MVKKNRRENIYEYEGHEAPSTARGPVGRPNPVFGKMEFLIDTRREILEMAQRGVDCSLDHKSELGVGVNDVDFVALLHDPRIIALREQFERYLDRYEAVEMTESSMPPPPSQADFYNRCAEGTRVVNFGSGDEQRQRVLAQKMDHLEVVHVDQKIGTGVEVVSPDDVVVSFNTLSQLEVEDCEKILDCDGIHVVPDIPELEAMGVAKEETPGVFNCKTASGEIYRDRVVAKKRGYKLRLGYKGLNSYKKRSLNIKMGREKNMGYPFQPDGKASSKLPSGDYTYKYDGVAARLEIRGKRCVLTFRGGTCFQGECEGDLFDAVIYCEVVAADDRYGALVPHRVCYFNGFRPYHCGVELRHFASRLNLEMEAWDCHLNDGKKRLYYLRGPQEMDSSKSPVLRFTDLEGGGSSKSLTLPHDGAIFRVDEKDFYVKYIWTFEHNDPESVCNMLEDNGFEVANEPGQFGQPADIDQFGWGDEIYEFIIRQTKQKKLDIRFNKKRTDRTCVDSDEKILFRANMAF